MKSRFRKVWCSSCSSMQFAGECPHPRIVDGQGVNGPAPNRFRMTSADVVGINLRRPPRELVLPPVTHWKEYKFEG